MNTFYSLIKIYGITLFYTNLLMMAIIAISGILTLKKNTHGHSIKRSVYPFPGRITRIYFDGNSTERQDPPADQKTGTFKQ